MKFYTQFFLSLSQEFFYLIVVNLNHQYSAIYMIEIHENLIYQLPHASIDV